MLPSEEISGRLPAPRPDEPEQLRRDIVDELADHLHCATAREQLRGERDTRRAERTRKRAGTFRRPGGRRPSPVVGCNEGANHCANGYSGA